MSAIEITDKMCLKAKEWTEKIDPNIQQHFTQKRIGKKETLYMSCLGEIAFCEMMGIDWQNLKRQFETYDNGDAITNKGKKMEIKTYSVPSPYFERLVSGGLGNDDPYGGCLVNEHQVFRLKECDYIFWGVFKDHEYDCWYPIGYMPTKEVLENYKIQTRVGDGRILLPFPALVVGNQDVNKLKKWYNEGC